MICPKCNHEFRGHQFWTTGVRGALRICPRCDHEFPEPVKKRTDKRDVEIEKLRALLRDALEDIECQAELRDVRGDRNPYGLLGRIQAALNEPR